MIRESPSGPLVPAGVTPVKIPVTLTIPPISDGFSGISTGPAPGTLMDESCVLTLGTLPATVAPGLSLQGYRIVSDGTLEVWWTACTETAGQTLDVFVTVFR
jgi:hypothetical protein